jgi:predicted phosphodiesterase
MKIRVMSDLHLEIDRYHKRPRFIVKPLPSDRESVLVLAGDVDTGTGAMSFITSLIPRFRAVIYVPGNHEYYENDKFDVDAHWLKFENVHKGKFFYLHGGESVKIDDTWFLGATMWTDMYKENPMLMIDYTIYMNDCNQIKWMGENWNSEKAVFVHYCNRERMRMELEKIPEGDKKVIVTHHAPCGLSIGEKYKGDVLNGAYTSDLTGMMHDYMVDLWIHGHMHNSSDYHVGFTRVVCNPRGYYMDANGGFNPRKVIEL